MAFSLNLGGNTLYSAPLGYPLQLSQAGQLLANGIVPPYAVTINADMYADRSCTAHLGLFYMPSSVGGPDGVPFTTLDKSGNTASYQTDLVLTTAIQTLTVTIPVGNILPIPFVFKVWVDSIPGGSVDAVQRDPSIPLSRNPLIPSRAFINQVYIS